MSRLQNSIIFLLRLGLKNILFGTEWRAIGEACVQRWTPID